MRTPQTTRGGMVEKEGRKEEEYGTNLRINFDDKRTIKEEGKTKVEGKDSPRPQNPSFPKDMEELWFLLLLQEEKSRKSRHE
jgi:hypothetical protein